MKTLIAALFMVFVTFGAQAKPIENCFVFIGQQEIDGRCSVTETDEGLEIRNETNELIVTITHEVGVDWGYYTEDKISMGPLVKKGQCWQTPLDTSNIDFGNLDRYTILSRICLDKG